MANLKKFEHVAVALIFSSADTILIARRHSHLHQGGKWEFPGGKIECGETVLSALKRECLEEVGLEILQAEPFCEIPFIYTEKKVLLDTWVVKQFNGEAVGCEQQELRWVRLSELLDYDFPEPNKKIISLLYSSQKL